MPDSNTLMGNRPSAATFLATLVDLGTSHLVGLPDNTSAALYAVAATHPDITNVSVTREGEAFAIASGLWLGGKEPVILVQNTGLLESGDSLRGTAVRMGVPLLCLVTYRGYQSAHAHGLQQPADGWSIETLTREDVDSAALLTEPTLEAWGIPHRTWINGELEAVHEMWNRARRESRPVALLLTEAFS